MSCGRYLSAKLNSGHGSSTVQHVSLVINETDCNNHQNLKWQYQITFCTDAKKKKLESNKKQNLKLGGWSAGMVVVEGSQFEAEKFYSFQLYDLQLNILGNVKF